MLSLLWFVPLCVYFFFFQAEDGIRDLVRSRGLGDVYKRQPGLKVNPQSEMLTGLHASSLLAAPLRHGRTTLGVLMVAHQRDEGLRPADPVSYTHLTPPTRELV